MAQGEARRAVGRPLLTLRSPIRFLEAVRRPEQANRVRLRVHLIGAMRAQTPDGADALPRARKARAVLAYLCLAGGRPIPRVRLAGEIWERVPDAQARVSLRQALLDLGRALGALRSDLLVADRDTVRFRVDRCWIDALALPDLAKAGPQAEAADLQPERLLEGLAGISAAFDQWIMTERASFGEAGRQPLEAGLNRAVISGAPAAERTAAARRLIAFDPT